MNQLLSKLLPNRISQLWYDLVRIGNGDHYSEWINKRIRIMNGISIVAGLIFLGFTLGYISSDYPATLYESLVATILYVLTIALNKWAHFNFTRVYFVIFNALLFFYFAIAHGEPDAAEYLLLCSSVSSMLFFRKFSTIALYFLFNMAIFWLAKYLFDYIEPFAAQEGANLYIENHVFTFVGLFFIVFHFNKENQSKEEQLELKNQHLSEEIEKSDRLLLNILPAEIATELKANGSIKPQYIDNVTVMFTDFNSFTSVSSNMSAEALVEQLNKCFTEFDRITRRNGIEKIKTIGDSYMCAHGLRSNDKGVPPYDLINAAMEMQDYVKSLRAEYGVDDENFFQMRVGIHSGPVIAGIVGEDKFAYDIWGNTVNTASRLESTCDIDQINISEACFELIKDQFNCAHRGKVKAKKMEDLDMYYVQGRS